MSNLFKDKMEILSNIELFQILEQRNDYQEKAVEAAENEIKKRNLNKEQVDEIFSQLKAIESEKIKKKNYYEKIKKVILKLIEYILIPFNFTSPSGFINSIGVLIIINFFWRFNFFGTVFFLLKHGMYYNALWAFSLTAIGVGIAISLFKKKKVGWIFLNLLIIYSLVNFIRDLYISFFILNIDPFRFNTVSDFLYYLFDFIIPLIIVVYINKKGVLDYFKIRKITQKIVLFICFAISIAGNFFR